MKHYLQKPHYFFLLIFAFLTGCATVYPNRLGISQADWDQYSPAKQEQLMSAYEQAQERKKSVHVQAGSGVLSVKVEGGKALLPPYTNLVAYQTVAFTIKQGDCRRKIPVIESDGGEKGKLEVCYKDDTLYLDPSPYDSALSLGSLQFPYMPVWKRGFTYPNVTSTGLLKLTNAQIYLRELVPADDN